MTNGLVYFVLLAAATLMIGTGLAWALNTHDPNPMRCTSAAAATSYSSNGVTGPTTTVWYPKGCEHK